MGLSSAAVEYHQFQSAANESQRRLNWLAGRKEIIQLTQSPEDVL